MVPHPTGRVQVGYYPNWAIYGRKYLPQQIPAEHLTHILYSFANLRPETGEVFLTDKWADEDIHWEGDSWNDVGTNMYGCFKQLYLLKKKHRHLKVLLSIGGWTYSPNFHAGISTPQHRAEFIRSAIQIVEDYGLDGLDIDYEYPRNEQEAQNYVDLLRECRLALDDLAVRKGEADNGYELTIAAPCGPSNFEILKIAEMDQYLSFWNLMAYDYAGSWDSKTGHQAAIYSHDANGISTSRAIEHFKGAGVRPEKLIMGIPLYGRSFANTVEQIGQSYNGVGQGSWEAGSYDYKALPLAGSTIHTDEQLIASYSYTPSTQELITYDTLNIVQRKIEWLVQQQLGGTMYWELSGDFAPGDPNSVVPNAAASLANASDGVGLDRRPNHLSFPNSKFDNLKAGM